MKKFHLVLITENQNSLEKAKSFAELICKELNCKNEFEILKYDKLVHSYKIEIIGVIEEYKNSILESIELTDRICSSWLVKFDRNENEIELLFNKSNESIYRKLQFNTLNWASFTIEPN